MQDELSCRDFMYSMVTVINNIILYTENLLKEWISGALITHTHKANYVRRWICELAWLEYSFHYVYVYQNIMLDTLNIYNNKK